MMKNNSMVIQLYDCMEKGRLQELIALKLLDIKKPIFLGKKAS